MWARVGSRKKEWISFSLYGLGVPAAFISPWLAIALYLGVSLHVADPGPPLRAWHSLQQSEAHSAP
jgi:hypothetical protein